MKFLKTQTNDVLPFTVILYSEERNDSIYSYVVKLAEDKDLPEDEFAFNKLNMLPQQVLASDRAVTLKTS